MISLLFCALAVCDTTEQQHGTQCCFTPNLLHIKRPLVEGRTSIDQPTRNLQYYKAGALGTPHLLQILQFHMSLPPALQRTCTQLYLHGSVCKRTQLFGASIESHLTFLRLGSRFLHLILLTVSTNTGPWLCIQEIVCTVIPRLTSDPANEYGFG